MLIPSSLSYGGINLCQKQGGPIQWQVLRRMLQAMEWLMAQAAAWSCSTLSWINMKTRCYRFFLLYEFEIKKRPGSLLLVCHGRAWTKFHCRDLQEGHIWSLPGAEVQNSLMTWPSSMMQHHGAENGNCGRQWQGQVCTSCPQATGIYFCASGSSLAFVCFYLRRPFCWPSFSSYPQNIRTILLILGTVSACEHEPQELVLSSFASSWYTLKLLWPLPFLVQAAAG